jgi:hypothetical protein
MNSKTQVTFGIRHMMKKPPMTMYLLRIFFISFITDTTLSGLGYELHGGCLRGKWLPFVGTCVYHRYCSSFKLRGGRGVSSSWTWLVWVAFTSATELCQEHYEVWTENSKHWFCWNIATAQREVSHRNSEAITLMEECFFIILALSGS